jgi:hypothetical protein
MGCSGATGGQIALRNYQQHSEKYIVMAVHLPRAELFVSKHCGVTV